MGPTNVALVSLFQADQKLREAQGRLDATTKNVRVQERRVRDLNDRINAANAKLKEQQAHGGNLDLDLKSRDAHIEKLRTQQQSAKTNKEYQAFLVEINTGKVDRNKIEEEAIKVLEGVEKIQAELKEMNAQLEGEKAKLATMQGEITARTKDIQDEINQLKPARDAAAQAVPAKAREAFERLADRFDGEAMSAIHKPDRRLEEYTCSACMMDLVRDVYNRLHTRDELVFCPSCRRILYIPDELPPELAVHKPKERKTLAGKAPPAAINRQTSAVDVMRSVNKEEDEEEETTNAPEPAAETAPPGQAESSASQDQPPVASPEAPSAASPPPPAQ
jgi:predicted  nucleic acid-binding Zn-ribbon protein